MKFETPKEIRDFLRLCLDPGHGIKRTPDKLAAIMPDLVRDRLEEYAPQLAELRQDAERAEGMAGEARTAYVEALSAWIADDAELEDVR
jgi:hypothetical protein